MSLARPPQSPARPGTRLLVAETALVVAASLCVYAVVGRLAPPDHPRQQALAFLVATALLPLRHRLPGPVLLASAVLAGPFPCLGPFTAVAAYTVGRRIPRTRKAVAVLTGASALLAGFATLAAPWTGPGGSYLYGFALGLVMAAIAVVVPGLVGTAYGQQVRLVRALRERTAASERARELADSEARTQERSSIAAEMHDLVGHRLSLIALHAGGLELALAKADPELRDEAVLLRRTTRDAMRELRQSLGVLGPLGRDTGADVLTDATGTRADIEALVAESRGGGIAVELEWSGPDLDAVATRVRRAVHRVVRESLTNVHRYATDAHVTVGVAHAADAVRVTVRNGAPTRPPAAGQLGTGRGLTGLRERVELLGGAFAATALDTGGFQVVAALPTDPDAAPSARSGGPADAVATTDATAATPARRFVAVLVHVLGLTVLSVLMALGILFMNSIRPLPPSTPTPPVHLGMSYADAMLAGIFDNPAVRAAAYGHEPPRPAGTTGCVFPFPFGGEDAPPKGEFTIPRYCFDASERLISIDRFTVPAILDGAPWEHQ
ncbi:histidine kinase [Streptomyces sp. NPDC001941]|uniref:sensor histidine kinase n=1 Tax=Streptomyces sp. NPDC001941 TaxID=3154659 RepID=UPI0033212176